MVVMNEFLLVVCEMRLLYLLVLPFALSGCLSALTLTPDSAMLKHDKMLYTTVRSCSSETLDVKIGLFGNVKDPTNEVWVKDTLILITIKQLDNFSTEEVPLPMTLAWFHSVERDPETDKKIPRTFTDFPNILKLQNLKLGAAGGSAQELEREMRRPYMEFLQSVVPDRPIRFRTLYGITGQIVPPYTTLIESCVYGF